MADVAGNRTGWDPQAGEIVVGSDTVVSTAYSVLGMIPDPTIDVVVNISTTAYSNARMNPGPDGRARHLLSWFTGGQGVPYELHIGGSSLLHFEREGGDR